MCERRSQRCLLWTIRIGALAVRVNAPSTVATAVGGWIAPLFRSWICGIIAATGVATTIIITITAARVGVVVTARIVSVGTRTVRDGQLFLIVRIAVILANACWKRFGIGLGRLGCVRQFVGSVGVSADALALCFALRLRRNFLARFRNAWKRRLRAETVLALSFALPFALVGTTTTAAAERSS